MSKFKASQALIELAVFISLFFVLFGVLVSYGVKYNYQQNIRQKAFRMALTNSKDRVSATAVLVEHNPVPDPADALGLGSSAMVVGSATVTKNYMYVVPEDTASLPTTHLSISGDGGSSFGTDLFNSAIRKEYVGEQQHCETGEDGSQYCWNEGIDPAKINLYRIVYGGVIDCSATSTDDCDAGNVLIVDSCAGNLPDYGTCKEAGRLATEPTFCAEKCKTDKLLTNTESCDAACSATIPTPKWWAGLDTFFSSINSGGIKEVSSLGLQQDINQTTTRTETITKAGDQTHPSGGGTGSDTIDQILKYQTSDGLDGGGAGGMTTVGVSTTTSTEAGIPSGD